MTHRAADLCEIAIKTKGKIENGHLVIEEEAGLFPQDGEVEVTVTLKESTSQSFREVDPAIKKSFEDAGIHSREQILELIRDVKREMYEERFGEKLG
jgi:hypothetical protein